MEIGNQGLYSRCDVIISDKGKLDILRWRAYGERTVRTASWILRKSSAYGVRTSYGRRTYGLLLWIACLLSWFDEIIILNRTNRFTAIVFNDVIVFKRLRIIFDAP